MLKVIDEQYGQGYCQNSVGDNRQIIQSNLSSMVGAEIKIDDNGFISVGEIYQNGADWDAAISRFNDLLSSNEIIGITTNTDSLTGWGFDPMDSSTSSSKNWAIRNGISAYVQISSRITGEYKHNNPKFSFLYWLFKGEKKYIYTTQSLAGATVREVLVHAMDYVINGRYWDEYSALNGENMYHTAVGEPSHDVYP
jgi:hypothetical protein